VTIVYNYVDQRPPAYKTADILKLILNPNVELPMFFAVISRLPPVDVEHMNIWTCLLY